MFCHNQYTASQIITYTAEIDKKDSVKHTRQLCGASVNKHKRTHTHLNTARLQLSACSSCPQGSSSQTWGPSYLISPADIHSFLHLHTLSLQSSYPLFRPLFLFSPPAPILSLNLTFYSFLYSSARTLRHPACIISFCLFSSLLFKHYSAAFLSYFKCAKYNLRYLNSISFCALETIQSKNNS